MTIFPGLAVFAALALSMPLTAQTIGNTAVPADSAPAPALTDAEQATLKKCMAMGPGQAAQSSKCSKVMAKAGMGDPAKDRGPNTGTNPPQR